MNQGYVVVGNGDLVGLQVSNSHMDFAYTGFLMTGGSATNWKLIGNYFTQNNNGYNTPERKNALTGGCGILLVKGKLFRCQIVGNTIETIRGLHVGENGYSAVRTQDAEQSIVQLNTFAGWKYDSSYGKGTGQLQKKNELQQMKKRHSSYGKGSWLNQ